ncbi:hypothetical protein J2Y38_002283 [Flavobacterium sp. 2755]|uniref:hypothetical protein n=1 Tax=Flavobacterium sp. 2755 TaxID=2817765 RepID=UPI00285E31BC|nr:hypothetical protein [Flavobacterium sp. 2755]MDR6762072.1 hypothetical protein [Flavobacterium sp. 2755]
MKKIILFVFFIFSTISFAQSYAIKVYDLNYEIRAGVKNSTTSNIRITLYYENGTTEDIYKRNINNNGDRETNLLVFSNVRNFRPVRIECFAFVNFRTGTDADSSVFKNVESGNCISGTFSGDYSPRMTPVTFKYTVGPDLKIIPNSNTILTINDNIKITSQSGFMTDSYRWQYSTDSVNWIDMPQFNGLSELNTNAAAILGNNANNYIDKSISIRQKACNVISNVVTYIVKKYSQETQTALDELSISSFIPEKGKYIVSGWVKENTAQQQITYSNSNITISIANGNGAPFYSETFKPSGMIIDGWQRILGIIEIPVTDPLNNPKLDITLNCTSTTADCYFDDIRFFPYNGNLKSFVYDEDTQKLMAELDENNYATFYEYDLEGGLVRVKKETEKGVYTIQETRSNSSKN